ncbi:cadherin-86C [Cephus cinctus]|uniref:Cadherin-86C n=1 Tax=Cephus cinctus TaxID=211228 RepID=A0AAJ7CC77_CEPCN|nr:cadherin-86C [Cephus cinctus]
MTAFRMHLVEVWLKALLHLGFIYGWTSCVRPQFDTSTDMGLVLVPADAEVDSVIFRLRATDQDADFPLIFDITATVTPIVRIENLPCTLYNKVCQANVILTRRLTPGRLHDFAVRVRDSKGDTNSMQATISVTNATTPRDKIFPHIPSLIMVPENTKPGKKLGYLLVRSNPWSGKPVYIELWQPKDLFTIRQRQTPDQTQGTITLIGELDFETQSMYTLTMYATDPYTEPGKDTRNIAGIHVVVVVQDVQDVPPVFTLAPPLTRVNNSVQPGDVILRVHAEDGDKGSPREVTYGLVSEGNPFTPFFNISETTGEISLARPLDELTQITHVGAPIVLTIVAEEIRRSREEPPAQATVVDVGLLLGEPGNNPPYFESDNYVAWMEENAEPGSMVTFMDQYSTRVKDEDIGKAGVFALKLINNNGTFEITPTVAERMADFVIAVRDNTLIDYETYKNLQFKIVAQEVGPATNLSAAVPVTIFLRDVNDNPPLFEKEDYEVTLSENVKAGTKVVQVRATDKDTGLFGSIQYTKIIGPGNESFVMDPDTGLITVAMGANALDREMTPRLQLSVEARDEDGRGLRNTVPLIINLLDVNDNVPIFEKDTYTFMLNTDLSNFTMPAIIKAIDADSEPPNSEVRYELIHGNYENKFYLNEVTGELILREALTKVRRTRHSAYQHFAAKFHRGFLQVQETFQKMMVKRENSVDQLKSPVFLHPKNRTRRQVEKIWKNRKKRADDDALYTLTVRAYDLGVPHLSSTTQVRILGGAAVGARTVMFVMPGEHLDPTKTAETLAAITGGRVTIQHIRPYRPQNQSNPHGGEESGNGNIKKSIVVARVEQTGSGTSLVDIERIRKALAANGVGIIGGSESETNTIGSNGSGIKPGIGVGAVEGGNVNTGSEGVNTGSGSTNTHTVNNTVTTINSEEVTVYKAENKLLLWLLIFLGLLMALAALALILCCICPGCPFYMAPRKRRVHSSETLIVRSNGRPKRHFHRKPGKAVEAVWSDKKQAWSADPTRRNWQFNRRNIRNRDLASLPGDIIRVPRQELEREATNAASLGLRGGPVPIYARDAGQRLEEERIYIEDVEGQVGRGYDVVDMDSLRRHELERGSDIPRQGYRYVDPRTNEEASKFLREQHFYREGNAEVLRLVTRGQLDENNVNQAQRPMTLVVDQQAGMYRDGKDILLRRFMEDQKIRHMQDLHDSMQEIQGHGMDSHQRTKESMSQQQEIILLPERLDHERRQHIEELTPQVQRLIIDHGDYDESSKTEFKDARIMENRQQQNAELGVAAEAAMVVGGAISKAIEKPSAGSNGRTMQSAHVQPYTVHEIELARRNALLTQLLLERENKGAGCATMDAASYLETQSLPGQVAIATQTDRTAATQTEVYIRSRSDNDESEEEANLKKKLKSKKRYVDSDLKRMRSLWVRSPIQEESRSFTEKRFSVLRRKTKEARDGRKISLEPEVLREISDSLDGNGSSAKEDEKSKKSYRSGNKESNIRYKVLSEGENDRMDTPSSPEINKEKYRKAESVGETSKAECKSGKSGKLSEPSFRILEKEISSLKRQIRKFGEKNVDESNDSDSNEKSNSNKKETDRKDESTESLRKRDSGVTRSKKQVDSKIREPKTVAELGTSETLSEEQTKPRKEENLLAKSQRMLKYHQSQKISTGSSEYEDAFDKPKKRSSISGQDQTRQKYQSGQSKVKLETRAKRKEIKEDSVSSSGRNNEVQKESTSQESSKSTSDSGKNRKESTLRSKYIGKVRKENISDTRSTSTNSEGTEVKKRGIEIRQTSEKKISMDPKEKLSKLAGADLEKTTELIEGKKISDESAEKSSHPEDPIKISEQDEKFHEVLKMSDPIKITKTDKESDPTVGISEEDSQESNNMNLERSNKTTLTRQDNIENSDQSIPSKTEVSLEKHISRQFTDDYIDISSKSDKNSDKDSEDRKVEHAESVQTVIPSDVQHSDKNKDNIEEQKEVDEKHAETKIYEQIKIEDKLQIFEDHPIVHEPQSEHATEPISILEDISQKRITESVEPPIVVSSDLIVPKDACKSKDNREMSIAKEESERLAEAVQAAREEMEIPVDVSHLKQDDVQFNVTNTQLESRNKIKATEGKLNEHQETENQVSPKDTMDAIKESENKSMSELERTLVQEEDIPLKAKSAAFYILSDNSLLEGKTALEKGAFNKEIDFGNSSIDKTQSGSTVQLKEHKSPRDGALTDVVTGEEKKRVKSGETDDPSISKENITQGKHTEAGFIEMGQELGGIPVTSLHHSMHEKDTTDDSDKSDTSSESSNKTMFHTEPYQTPRHRIPKISEKKDNQLRQDNNGEYTQISEDPKTLSKAESTHGESPKLKFGDTVDPVHETDNSVLSIDDVTKSNTANESTENPEKMSSSEKQRKVPIVDPISKGELNAPDKEKKAPISGKTDKDNLDRNQNEKQHSTSGTAKGESETKKKDKLPGSGIVTEIISQAVGPIKKVISSSTERKKWHSDKAQKKPSTIKTDQATSQSSGDTGSSQEGPKHIRDTQASKISSRIKRRILPHVNRKKEKLKDSNRTGQGKQEGSSLDEQESSPKEKSQERKKSHADPKKPVEDSESDEKFEEAKSNVQHVTSLPRIQRQAKGSPILTAKEQESRTGCKKKDGDAQQKSKTKSQERQSQTTRSKGDKEKDSVSSNGGDKSSSPPKTGDAGKDGESEKTQSRYMSWYKQKREEMEKKRKERKEAQEEEQRPRWMRRSLRYKRLADNQANAKDGKTPEATPRSRRKVKPLVNVESEQLKAIVRQGRKLRKAEGGQNEDPPVEIFAPEKPPSPPPSPPGTQYHPLVQHSQYKYEKIPPPFYLHPPPVPHSTPQLSPEHFQGQSADSRRPDDDLDSGIAVSLQGGARLRHQQLLEKKSVFDIAYSEAAPSQLRADSTTPPS